MDRRVFLLRLSGAGAGLMLGAGAAMAEAPVDAVIRQLESFGYRNVRVSRTLLGRMRVTGRRGQSSREIVLDPRTGEILRDLVREGGGGRTPELRDDRGTSFSDDGDDDRDNDDRDDDRDNSGSGNSNDDDDDDNSGSGGGSDDDDDDD